MSPEIALKSLTYEDCLRLVDEEVFRFRPSDYQEKHPKWPGQVGLEIEMFAFDHATFMSGGVPSLQKLFGGSHSTTEQLMEWAKRHTDWQVERDSATGNLIRIVLERGDQITFEPGGQVEFSSIPYPCLSDALERMEAIQGSLRDFFASVGVTLLQTGINPWQSVDEIGLQMAKPRYRAMNDHFNGIGLMGQRMMRQTATVQVNLDFGDSGEILAKRYLVSNLMAPFATAIFANSPQVNQEMSKSINSTRAEAWRTIDPDRTGIPNLSKLVEDHSKEQCVHLYLNYLLDAAVIFIEKLGYERPSKRLTFREWINHGYKNIRPTMQDFKIHQSLHFPEVRARGFLELRSVDCQGRAWQSVPASFYTAILYVERCLDKALEWLEPELSNLDQLLREASYGLRDKRIKHIAQNLMNLAVEGFAGLPPCFQGEGARKALLVFNEHFTQRGRSPADDLRDQASKSAGILFGTDFKRVEDYWLDLLN